MNSWWKRRQKPSWVEWNKLKGEKSRNARKKPWRHSPWSKRGARNILFLTDSCRVGWDFEYVDRCWFGWHSPSLDTGQGTGNTMNGLLAAHLLVRLLYVHCWSDKARFRHNWLFEFDDLQHLFVFHSFPCMHVRRTSPIGPSVSLRSSRSFT